MMQGFEKLEIVSELESVFLLLDLLVDFFTMHWYVLWCINAKPDLIVFLLHFNS